ncbi:MULTISPECIES: hypothetical protein [Ferrimicrobium]|jgi:hypothetical protein|uniref:hypothetical protein n=1 Tax=Ferrimicrobium TaxID=121038 RepID=UPI0023F190D8|nr:MULTISPECIES: hypothetical protein [Ferrimicrobium]
MTITALRGLREEYGTIVDASSIEWVSFIADIRTGQYSLIGAVRLDIPLIEFARHLHDSEDTWEREQVYLAPFTSDDIASLLERTGPWTALGCNS